MKNTLDYGFRPGANARANAIALQNALIGGGDVEVTEKGIYDIDMTVVLESHTTLRFGEGVYLRRVPAEDGIYGYTFVNRGAFTRTYDTDIKILGLNLLCNGVDTSPKAENMIPGLRGQLSFFYVKDLTIRDLTCPDLGSFGFCVQICTFENVLIENVSIEGKKDGVHFGKGKNFVVRHGRFRTFDDPIAINAHDYSTANPQLGWIENGLIEDCYDLNDDATTGYFCRILAGSWCRWFEGMEVQHSDTVLHEGRLYRVLMSPNESVYRSLTPPTHEKGEKCYDGINWVMIQDDDPILNCGCRNLHFKDIHLQKQRRVGLSIHFDNDKFSRSVYPGSVMPVQENITFENIYTENTILLMLFTVTPAKNIVFKNSELTGAKFSFSSLAREGLTYPKADIHFENVTFAHPDAGRFRAAENREVEVMLDGCTAVSDFKFETDGKIQVIGSIQTI